IGTHVAGVVANGSRAHRFSVGLVALGEGLFFLADLSFEVALGLKRKTRCVVTGFSARSELLGTHKLIIDACLIGTHVAGVVANGSGAHGFSVGLVALGEGLFFLTDKSFEVALGLKRKTRCVVTGFSARSKLLGTHKLIIDACLIGTHVAGVVANGSRAHRFSVGLVALGEGLFFLTDKSFEVALGLK